MAYDRRYAEVESLVDIGLTENEALVYRACLSQGATTALKIARAADMKRSTVYLALESLIAKGLVSIRVIGLKRFYQAENPKRLRIMIEERKDRLLATLPSLSALYTGGGDASDIRYYEGLPAVKSVYESLLLCVKPRDDYFVVSDMSQWLSLDKEYFLSFARRRAKMRLNIRMLLIPNAVARTYAKKEWEYNFKIKILPPKISLITNLVIVPSMIVINQLIPPIHAVVIKNNSIVQMHRELFEVLWHSR